jgi:hypothetical protein
MGPDNAVDLVQGYLAHFQAFIKPPLPIGTKLQGLI